uniref:Uncharacterized protein n=1 Tax=Anguilla anguilla TaxID=7936 RepID=A0A0E9TMM6_ANGAN
MYLGSDFSSLRRAHLLLLASWIQNHVLYHTLGLQIPE